MRTRTLMAFACGLAACHAVAIDDAARADIYSNILPSCDVVRELPAPDGPMQVGVTNLFFVDAGREEGVTDNPHDLRQVPLTVWYPAAISDSTNTAEYMPGLDQYRAGFMADRREIVRSIGQRFDAYGCVKTSSYSDAPVIDTDSPMPLIMFSPGGLMSRFYHTVQAQDLAANGFVVAVIGHHYSGSDVYPRGGFDFDPMLWRASDGMSEEEALALDDALTDMLAADARFALDQMIAIADGTLEHPLNRAIDTDRVAILGHSRGGSTVARACWEDPRFLACVTFDNIGPDKEVASGITTPQLAVRAAWDEERTNILASYQDKNPTWAIDAVLPASGHFTYSDLEFVDPENYPSDGDTMRLQRLSTQLTMRFLNAVWAGGPEAFDAQSTDDMVIHVRRAN